MKVAVIGSRCFKSFNLQQLLSHLPPQTTKLVSGGAIGVDRLAEDAAKSLDIPIKIFLPDYDLFGRQAPLARNRLIVDYADLVLAFWDNQSRGTAYTLNYCIDTNKPFQIFTIQ